MNWEEVSRAVCEFWDEKEREADAVPEEDYARWCRRRDEARGVRQTLQYLEFAFYQAKDSESFEAYRTSMLG